MSGKLPLLSLALLSLAALSSAGAHAESVREKIELMLLERHPDDGASRWTALGSDAPGVIIRMIEGADRVPHKIRLLGALRFFPDSAEAVEYLKRQAETSSSPLVQRSAVRSVGASQGAKEAEFVAKFLASGDANLRVAAAQSLQAMRDPGADARLKKHLATEKTAWVVAKVKESQPSSREARALSVRAAPEVPPAPAIDPGWEGKWKGVSLRPDPGSAGMKSEEARFELDPGRMRAGLSVASASFSIESLRIDGKRFRGAVRVGGSAEPEMVEAELLQRGGTALMQIQLLRSGYFVVLRKGN